eukprot:6704097-Prorocentrum_lima.AAC.1
MVQGQRGPPGTPLCGPKLKGNHQGAQWWVRNMSLLAAANPVRTPFGGWAICARKGMTPATY